MSAKPRISGVEMDIWCRMSISERRIAISDSQIIISKRRMVIYEHRKFIPNRRIFISMYRIMISKCQIAVSDSQLSISEHRIRIKARQKLKSVGLFEKNTLTNKATVKKLIKSLSKCSYLLSQ